MRDERIRKTDIGYLPSDGEPLKSYATRLRDIAEQLRGSNDFAMHQTKFWCHTNPNSSYCFVCNMMDMIEYIIEVTQDICSEDKKNIWKCSRPTASHDALTFEFKPHPVKQSRH